MDSFFEDLNFENMNPLVALFDLFFPNLCVVCGNNLLSQEKEICMTCICNLPKTNYHLQKDNAVEKRFWGKVEVQSACSFFFFQKGSMYQKILHELKYRGNKEVGVLMAKYAAVDLMESNSFVDVDLIVPVPLHPKKYKLRGYNQSECIGSGLSEIMQKPQIIDCLVRSVENVSQTKKTVFERFENTKNVFEVAKPHLLSGKHVLLVDDVLTTGSTLEACIHTLLQVEGVVVSVFTLAVA